MKKQITIQQRRKRKLKGGKSILNSIIGSVEGNLIPDNIEQAVILGNKQNLIDEYKRKKEIAEKNASDTKLQYDELNKIIQLEKTRSLTQDELNFKKNTTLKKQLGNTITNFTYALWTVFVFIAKFVIDIIKKILDFFAKFIITLSKSNSPFIKVICLLIVLIIIIVVIISSVGGINSTYPKFDFKKATSVDIFTQTKIPSLNPFTSFNFSTFSFDNIIFSYKMFMNKFNKMLGNDVIGESIDNQIRETINTGRWDGIYHVKKDNNDIHVYSTLQPNYIIFNLDIKKYPDSDYFKLPKDVREKIYNNSNAQNIVIPIKVNPTTTKYSYDFNNAYYYNNPTNKVDIPMFKDDDNRENVYIVNDIDIDDYIFTDGDNINLDVLKTKMFKYENNKFTYPMDYINNKIK